MQVVKFNLVNLETCMDLLQLNLITPMLIIIEHKINLSFRSLNKQIKDKKEHRDKLAEDMKKDGEKQVQLEKKIEVLILLIILSF